MPNEDSQADTNAGFRVASARASQRKALSKYQEGFCTGECPDALTTYAYLDMYSLTCRIGAK